MMLSSVLRRTIRPSSARLFAQCRVGSPQQWTHFPVLTAAQTMAFSSSEMKGLKGKKMQTVSPSLTFIDHSSSDKAVGNRTLVLLFSWMLAKGQHLDKFIQFYGNYGYDVLLIKTQPMQLVFPKNGTMKNGQQVVQFLADKPIYSNVIVHGFSVGAYQFGEVLVALSKEKAIAEKVSPLFRALIFDSAANLAAIPSGFSKALTRNIILEKILFVFLHLYLKLFYFVATKYYKESEREYYEMNHFRVPSLLLVSERDPVGSVASNQVVADEWKKRGIPVKTKIWKDSKHVGHYYKHQEEYEDELRQMINKIK